MEVVPVPQLKDNYGYVLKCSTTGHGAFVDVAHGEHGPRNVSGAVVWGGGGGEGGNHRIFMRVSALPENCVFFFLGMSSDLTRGHEPTLTSYTHVHCMHDT